MTSEDKVADAALDGLSGSGHSIYNHITLDPRRREIRLLTVLPGQRETRVSVKLSKTSLDEEPDFNVLSYAWNTGPENGSLSIQIEEHEFPVSRHLYQCLLNLRHEAEPVVIWIDAVCINQDSIEEKNTQVPLMRDIYRSARQVYVWLGEPTPGIEVALASVRELLRRGNGFKLESFEQLVEGLDTSPATFVDGVEEFLHISWFRRTWIIQEASLPRQDPIFVCGPHRIEWNDLVHWKKTTSQYNTTIIDHASIAANPAWQRLHSMLDFRPFGALVSMRDIVTNSEKAKGGLELSTLLFLSKESLATDPRDKIYGTMGLANAAARSSITIDYNKDVEELYEEVTRYLIFTEGKLDIIAKPSEKRALVEESRRRGEALGDEAISSWIRDFRFKTPPAEHEYSLIPDWCGRSMVYDAALRSSPMEVAGHQPRELRIVGMRLDVVKECVFAWYKVAGKTQIFKNWGDILPVFFRVGQAGSDPTENSEQPATEMEGPVSEKKYQWNLKYSPRGRPLKTIKEAIWRTMVADKKVDGFTRPPNWYGSFIQGYVEAYLGNPTAGIMVEGDDLPSDVDGSQAVDEFHDFQRRMGDIMVGRKAFSTRDGWIGMGPDIMKEGDVIAILSGGDAPFVLRPCQKHYHVVGNCYVEGVMYGEIAREGMEKGGTQGDKTIKGEMFAIL